MVPNTLPAAENNRPPGNSLLKLTFYLAILFLSSAALNGNAATAPPGYLKSVAITDAAGTNAPPTAVISYSNAGDLYTFDASQSSDTDGSIVSYKWKFGTDALVEGMQSSYKVVASPTLVTLTVTDSKGGVAITQTEITSMAPFETIVDDADTAAFKTSGSWTQATHAAGYYGVGYKSIPAGTGSSTATWTLTLPTSGTYQVFCYYTASSNRASNAPYILKNNGEEIARVAVNQEINGRIFFPIGSYALTKGTLEIILTDGGNEYAIADAVKIAYVP
ncbi:MAG: hypothetical protein VR65_11680 [Desulfobulbaceae bacterium BRH_c16a]|nr:MAG: hypothetical protein VR65_11680 [Desulfobulbaceae bacterium BRH_c16a]